MNRNHLSAYNSSSNPASYSIIHFLTHPIAVVVCEPNHQGVIITDLNAAMHEFIGSKTGVPITCDTIFDCLNCHSNEYLTILSQARSKQVQHICSLRGETKDEKIVLIASCISPDTFVLELIPEFNNQTNEINSLRAEADKYKVLAENVTDVIWTMDLNLVTTYVSPSIIHLTGYTPEEHLKQTLNERFAPSSVEFGRTQFAKEYQRLSAQETINNNYTFTGEMEYRKKYGGTVWTEIRVKAVRDSNGKIIGLQGASRDISERKKNEKALQESEQRFRTIYELSPGAISVIDLTAKLITMNQAALQLLEIDDLQQVVNKDMFSFIAPESLSYAQQIFTSVLEKNILIDIELSLITLKKNKKYVSISASVLRNASGAPTGIISITTDLTARKTAEKELEQYKNHLEELVSQRTQELVQSEKKLKELFNTIRDGAVQTNLKGEILQCNPAFEQLTGYSNNELHHKSFSCLLNHEGIKTDAIILKDAVMRQGYSDLYRVIIKRKDNTFFPAEIQTYVTIENGIPEGIFRLIRDITQRVRYETELLAGEEKMRAIVHNLRDVICIIDVNGKIKYLSPSIHHLIGYTPEQLLNTSIYDLAHPADLQEAINRLKKVINKTNEGNPLEMQIKHLNGHYILIEAVAENLLDHPLIEGLIITVHDITEKRKAEILLLESERRFRAIFNSAAPGIALVSPDGIPMLSNPSLQKLLGYSAEEMNQLSFEKITHTDDIAISSSMFHELLKGTRDTYQIDKRYINRAGQLLWVHLSVTALRNKQNELESVLAIITDITEQKRAEEQIKMSEEKFRNIFNASSDGITITDINGNYLEVNEMAMIRSGISREQFMKINISDILRDEDPSQISKMRSELLQKGSIVMESEYTNKEGRRIYLEIRSRLINYEGKKAFLHITREVTDRKMLEQQLVKAIYETEEKERNRFARELHDGLGALLSGIKMYVNLLHKGNIPDKQKNILFEKTKELVSHAVDTTRELANNIKPPELSKFGLITSIETFIERIEGAGNIIFNFSSPGYRSMDADIELVIYRVLCELINNTLKYATANRVEILLHQQNEKIMLRYNDNGIGFDLKKQLKSPKGMGLQNILSRMRSLNGTCQLSSRPGKGMQAIIELKGFIKSDNTRKKGE